MLHIVSIAHHRLQQAEIGIWPVCPRVLLAQETENLGVEGQHSRAENTLQVLVKCYSPALHKLRRLGLQEKVLGRKLCTQGPVLRDVPKFFVKGLEVSISDKTDDA